MDKVVKKLAPELRFDEFDGEWAKIKLEKFSKIIRGASPRPKGNKRFYGGNVPRLMVKDVTRDGKYVYPKIDFLTEEGAKRSRPCKAGTLTIVCSGTVGIVSFLGVDACIHDGFIALLNIDESIVDTDFLYHQLSTLQEIFDSSATHGGVFTNLTTSGIKEFIISISTIKEQQKIANFLTAVDQHISLLKQKKAALETYKKGLMQKIFSQEVRFKNENGDDYPDWEEKKLGDIGSFQGGGTPSTIIDDYWKGQTPWVSSSDIKEESVNGINITRYISDDAIHDSATKLIPKNSLLIVSRVGIGKLAVNKEPVCTSQDFSNFTPEKHDVTFIGYLLLFNKNKLFSVAQGTSIKGFTIKDLKSLKILIPQIQEQQKIAECLSSMDQSINKLKNQIKQTTQFKIGLLQKMFV